MACRKLHAATLEWVMFLNLWDGVVYKLVLGDKDTFEIGFMLAGDHEAFFRMPLPPRAAFTAQTEVSFPSRPAPSPLPPSKHLHADTTVLFASDRTSCSCLTAHVS